VVLQGILQSTKNPASTLQTFSILGAIAETPSPHKGEPEHFVVTSDTAAIASIDICTLERRLKGTVSASVGRKPTLADIKKVPLFTGLSERLLLSLIKYAIVRSFSPNEVIINEKDNGNALFVIVAGEVDVTQQSCSIRTMGILDYFGERALLSNGKRTATVTAKTDTICWSFERSKLPLRSKEEGIKEKLLARIALQDNSPQLSDLVVIKHIPVDIPGTPFLVAHSTKLEFYALEVVDKSRFSPRNLRDFEWEKQLLLNLYHPFLLRHVKTIDEPRFSYILTVYENGSDLFEVLRDFGRELTEEEAKFCIACLILVVEFLHRRKICIRNLKPENILIDTSGYPLISNLECSKQLSEKTFTMVGAPHYMAPEMINRKGYGLEVDYWSLGIMLYESIYGRVPFGEDEQSPMKVYNEILKAELAFPLQTTDRARDVISSLLEPQPSRRASGSLSKLKKMPWFEGIAWVKPMQDLLMNRKVNAPYKSKGKDLRHMLPKALAKSESIQHAMNVFSR
jgi:cGMP-dependent protein kinase